MTTFVLRSSICQAVRWDGTAPALAAVHAVFPAVTRDGSSLDFGDGRSAPLGTWILWDGLAIVAVSEADFNANWVTSPWVPA